VWRRCCGPRKPSTVSYVHKRYRAYSIRFTDKIGNTTSSHAQYAIFVRRGVVVRIYAFTVMVTLWLITILFASITLSSVVLGHRLPAELLVVPVGSFFAFPQLRTSLPGIPDVSAVDYVCLHPCLIILSLSAICLLIVTIYPLPTPNPGRRSPDSVESGSFVHSY